jgi:ATP synthase protein I
MMDDLQKRMALITIPFALGVPPIFGWWMGSVIDRKLNTTPWFTYIVLFLGFVAGVKETIRIIKRFSDDEPRS